MLLCQVASSRRQAEIAIRDFEVRVIVLIAGTHLLENLTSVSVLFQSRLRAEVQEEPIVCSLLPDRA